MALTDSENSLLPVSVTDTILDGHTPTVCSLRSVTDQEHTSQLQSRQRDPHLVLAVRHDVVEPLLVVGDRVARQRRQLDTLRAKLLVLERQAPDLRRAHWLRSRAQSLSAAYIQASSVDVSLGALLTAIEAETPALAQPTRELVR